MLRSGIIIADKPKGITSREAAERIREITGAQRAGNSGTLDPNATGVLVVCIGNATKIMPALQALDKEYVATIHFHSGISLAALGGLIKRFSGKIRQVPPVNSAVARKEREREIYSIEILGMDGKDASLKIRCEAGTYIRKLADDMGRLCGGAHLKELRRTAVGNFTIDISHSLQEIEKASEKSMARIILPVEHGVTHLKKLTLKEDALRKALLGKPLVQSDFVRGDSGIENGELIALMDTGKCLIALAHYGKTVFVDRVISTGKV